MNLTDYKGRLIARKVNLEAQLTQHRQALACAEAEVMAARHAAAITEGCLMATARDLADLEPSMPAPGNQAAPPLPPPGKT